MTKNIIFIFLKKSMNGFLQIFNFLDLLSPFFQQISHPGYYSMGNFIFYHYIKIKYGKNIILGRLEAKNTFFLKVSFAMPKPC
jgi:hypothetical protein